MPITRATVWQQTFNLSIPPNSSRMVIVGSGNHGYILSGRIISDLSADGQLELQIYSRWPCYLDLGGQEDNCPAGGDPDELFELLVNERFPAKAGVIDLNWAESSDGKTAHREALIPFVNLEEVSERRNQIYVVLTNLDGVNTQNVIGRLSGVSGDLSIQ